jgi:hypothetical protein
MSVLTAIKNIILAILELFKEKETVSTAKPTTSGVEHTEEHTQLLHPSVGIIDPVEFAWHFGHLPYDEQLEIQAIIEGKKAAGIKNYTFKTKSSKTFRVVNGGQILESTEGYTKPTEE